MLRALFAAPVLLLIGTTAFAAPAMSAGARVKPAPLICPVTGEKIASIKDAAGSSTYHGKTYYFCCPGCKPLFDKDPAKYIKSAKVHTLSDSAAPKM
jgi:YHS domain-containing protein